MVLEVTKICAGVLILIWIALMLAVIRVRSSNRVSMGDGGIPTLATRIRGHANFMEVTPLFLLVLAFAELGIENMPNIALYIFAGTFVFGRIFHGIGFSGPQPSLPGRIIGTACSMTCVGMLGMYCLCGWNIYGHIVAASVTIIGAVIRLIIIPRLKPIQADVQNLNV